MTMKNYVILILLSFTLFTQLQGQNDRYTAAMSGIVADMQPVEGQDVDWQGITNKLERISTAEPGEWLPAYYLSYAALQQAMREMTRGKARGVVKYVKIPERHLAVAKERTEMNSELKCMEGYVMQGYIWIDPMNNGPQYAGAAHAAYAAAADLDATNPRPHMLRGMLTLFTPEFFGGGAEKAMPLLEQAANLYTTETATDRGIQPAWGQTTNDWMLRKAQADLAASEE